MNSSATVSGSMPLARLAGSLAKAVDAGSTALAFAGGVLLAGSSLVITYDVFSRWLFRSPLEWAYELSIILVLLGVFLTVAYGVKAGSHVRVELLLRLLPTPGRLALEVVSLAFVLGYSLFFLRYALDMVGRSFVLAEKTTVLDLPVGPLKAVIVLCFVMVALQVVPLMVAKAQALLEAVRARRSALVGATAAAAALVAAFALGVAAGTVFSPVVGLILLLLVLLAAGVPISFTVGIVATVGLIGLLGPARGITSIVQMHYHLWNDFSYTCLPLFIFLDRLMHRSELGKELFHFARLWVGHLPGGLAVATLVACAIFAAMSGSTVANAAVVGLVAISQMVAYKYDRRMAAGLVAAGGTLGILIPPSNAMVLIGIAAEESIGHLFMAEVVPGILAFLVLSAAAVLICKRTGAYEPLPRASWKERLAGTREALGCLAIPVIILGGIYSGVFTPTEAAGVAVAYVLVFVLLTRRVSPAKMADILTDSGKTVAMFAILVPAAIALGNVAAMLQVPQAATEYIAAAGWPGWAVILGTMVLILIMGCFLDGPTIVLLTIPTLAPVIRALGYDMLWYAVLVVLNTEIGLLTPPVGMNLFVIQQVSGVDLPDVVRGTIPFILVLLVVLVIVALFPSLSLWLPRMM